LFFSGKILWDAGWSGELGRFAVERLKQLVNGDRSIFLAEKCKTKK